MRRGIIPPPSQQYYPAFIYLLIIESVLAFVWRTEEKHEKLPSFEPIRSRSANHRTTILCAFAIQESVYTAHGHTSTRYLCSPDFAFGGNPQIISPASVLYGRSQEIATAACVRAHSSPVILSFGAVSCNIQGVPGGK
jgi:hypothetical protein